jgi:hypothetical protein
MSVTSGDSSPRAGSPAAPSPLPGFTVHNVPINPELLPAQSPDVLTRRLSSLGAVVAVYHPDEDLPVVKFYNGFNLFGTSVEVAIYQHNPHKLSPNTVWLTIVQGFSIYVNRHAEALRGKFVAHEGKKVINIVRSDFRYGSQSNAWDTVFPQFADAIESLTVPGVREKIEGHFSNTTPTDTACSHIALMDSCQAYFEYEMTTGCGFPRIDLLGTVADWRLLRSKAAALREFQPDGAVSEDVGFLSVWLDALLPALDHFVAAAEGHPDLAFWGSVCNLCGSSGGPEEPVTGWIGALFPYITARSAELVPNPSLNLWRECFEVAKSYGVEKALELAKEAERLGMDAEGKPWLNYGIELVEFPAGLSKAPVHVQWLDVNKEQDLLFYGGVLALHQHPDGAVEARTGWGVVDSSKTTQRRAD